MLQLALLADAKVQEILPLHLESLLVDLERSRVSAGVSPRPPALHPVWGLTGGTSTPEWVQRLGGQVPPCVLRHPPAGLYSAPGPAVRAP